MTQDNVILRLGMIIFLAVNGGLDMGISVGKTRK